MPRHRRTGRALVHRSAQWYHDPMHAGTAKLPDDFIDAHRRHWEDAELLFDSGRWPNADQLYGISAECGLKALVMRCPGMPPKIPRKYKEHVDKLWPIFEDFAREQKGGRYLKLATRRRTVQGLVD